MCVQCAAAYINISLCLHFTLCVYMGIYTAVFYIVGKQTARRWMSVTVTAAILLPNPSTKPLNGILRIEIKYNTIVANVDFFE